MINKLRKKFIIINMLLVSSVLLIVFSAICITSYSQALSETNATLRQAMEMRGGDSPPKLEIGIRGGDNGKIGNGIDEGFGDDSNEGWGAGPGDMPGGNMSGREDSGDAIPGSGLPGDGGDMDAGLPGGGGGFPTGGNRSQREPFMMIPVFCVVVGENESRITMQQNVSVSEEVAFEAAERVIASGTSEGILKDLGLRYLIRNTPEGTKVAFADRSNETATVRNVMLSSLAIGLGGLLAFYLISLFLAKWALRPVEKAWKQQRQFVADASHELKTPLTVILANTGILLNHKKDTVENQQKWVENTQAEALRMKGLVDDMLFLAKSDAQKAPEIFHQVNFSDVLWHSILPFEPVAFEEGITIQSEIAPDVYVMGDDSQLKQLVVILMDNACKYAGKNGEIQVYLWAEQEKAYLKVTNTGSLIDREDLDHIFERFYRADKSRERKQGGYGLGLAIAGSIIERHGGHITAESTEEGGTSFIIKLKLAN